MWRLPHLVLVALGLLSARVEAQQLVVSPRPETVSVTVYSDRHRSPGDTIDAEDGLGGYALITETRMVDLPPGAVTIRFEGVASGIQPETAILSEVDAREKNQDRLLLSQSGLIDAFTGQRVTVRRTDKATGRVTEEQARIRSGANGIVLETASGFEALQCTGQAETILYPNVPATLSAKPVLSVTTRDQPGGRRTVTLSYLASDFDWQANYVGQLSDDGRRMDLFAWVTLASADDVSFERAQANAVAGRVARADRDDDDDDDDDDEYYYARCWPAGTTGSSGALQGAIGLGDNLNELPQLRSVQAADLLSQGDIIVTGSRIATREDLGDLKLYRIPFPVTVASNSQKQVAFLSKPDVRGTLLYRSRISGWNDGEYVQLLFRVRNTKENGLGEPLPSGSVTLFQNALGRRMLVGETSLLDKTVGEEVEFVFAEPFNVDVESEELDEGDNWSRRRLTVTNANPFPIRFEAEFRHGFEHRFDRFGRKVVERDGKKIWSVVVPANGKSILDFRATEVEEEEDEGEADDD
jgi:hypothetical protein